MLGRVFDLDFLGQSACLLRRECGVKRALGVGVEVVAHQRDPLRLGKHLVEFTAHASEIGLFAMLCHHQALAQARRGLADHHHFRQTAA